MDGYTTIIEQDGGLYFAYCPEIPEATAQGQTEMEARANLATAIEAALKERDDKTVWGE